MMRIFGRLRTQLIVSHLIAIACTLVAMATAVVWIAGSWFAGQHASLSEPTQQAQAVAEATRGLIDPAVDSPDLNVVLHAMADGKLHVPAGPAYSAAWTASRSGGGGTALKDVAYLAVVSPGGDLLASSDVAGAAFAPPERKEWDGLVRAALAEPPNDRQLVALRPGAQPAALGAYPVPGPGGLPAAVVILASRSAPSASAGLTFWRSLELAGAASAATLAGASVFALLSAGLIGYLLSRRLVARLERLGQAAEALAGGNLSQRVEEGTADEVGQLARRFNAMAARLTEMVAELTATRRKRRSRPSASWWRTSLTSFARPWR